MYSISLSFWWFELQSNDLVSRFRAVRFEIVDDLAEERMLHRRNDDSRCVVLFFGQRTGQLVGLIVELLS
jgi:hypothetical protein